MPLSWVEAERSHAQQVQNFVCATPPSKIFNGTRIGFHPAPWALDAQSYIRGFVPPLSEPDYMLLGYDGTTLATVVVYARDDSDEYWIIDVIGRAISFRGRGYGDETLEETLRRIDQRGLSGWVVTQIHRDNKPSKTLFEEAGFTNIPDQDDGDSELWVLDRLEQRSN